MTITAVACARDEIDVIEAFVRHTLACVPRLVVLDNGSSDGTLGVLQALQKEGLPLDVLEDSTPGKYLSRRNTALMHEYAIGRHHAEWIVPLDVDEFLLSSHGSPLIPPGTPTDRPINLWWRSYVPHEADDSKELNPVVRLRHRTAQEANPIQKIMVPAALGRRPDAVISQGSHHLLLGEQIVPPREIGPTLLAHFPIRSPEQFVVKTVIGYLQNEVMVPRNPEYGWYHRENYELLHRDPEQFTRTYARNARRYAMPASLGSHQDLPPTMLDPFPYRGGALRYTPRRSAAIRMCRPILDYAQSLVREHGFLRASLTSEGLLSFERQGTIFAFLMEQLGRRQQEAIDHTCALYESNQRLHECNQRLYECNQRLANFQDLQLALANLRGSLAYRLGRLVLAPLVSLKRVLRKSSLLP